MKVVFLDSDLKVSKYPPKSLKYQLVKYFSLENALLALPCPDNGDKAKCLDIWFSNPTKWKDPYETFLLNTSKYRNNVLAQSFTASNTSEAQWMAYSKDELSLQYTFSWPKFLSFLESVDEPCTAYIGEVQYMKLELLHDTINRYSKERGHMSLVKQLFLKRLAYKYEEEIRIVLVYDKKLSEQYAEGKVLTNAPLEMLSRITICPQAKEETTSLLKKSLKHRSSCAEVYKSQLYKEINKI